MNEEAKKAISDLIRQLANTDSGNLLALQIVIETLLESGALDRALLLDKIGETIQKCREKNTDYSLYESVLWIGHQLDPDKHKIPERRPFLDFLEKWSPTGSKH